MTPKDRRALARGTVVVVPGSRRRVVGVEIDRGATIGTQLHKPMHGFWVLFR